MIPTELTNVGETLGLGKTSLLGWVQKAKCLSINED